MRSLPPPARRCSWAPAAPPRKPRPARSRPRQRPTHPAPQIRQLARLLLQRRCRATDPGRWTPSAVRADADRFCAASGSTEHAIDLAVVNFDFTGDGGLDAVATFSCAGDDGVPRPQALFWKSEDVPGSSPEEVFDTSDVEAIFDVTRQGSGLRFATFQNSGEITRTFTWKDGAWVGDLEASDDLATGLVSGPDEAISYLCNGEEKPRLVKVSSDPYATSVLQTVLAGGLVVDGRYGARTRLAVEAYQSDRGLTVDGLTGPETWGDLASVTCSGD